MTDMMCRTCHLSTCSLSSAIQSLATNAINDGHFLQFTKVMNGDHWQKQKFTFDFGVSNLNLCALQSQFRKSILLSSSMNHQVLKNNLKNFWFCQPSFPSHFSLQLEAMLAWHNEFLWNVLLGIDRLIASFNWCNHCVLVFGKEMSFSKWQMDTSLLFNNGKFLEDLICLTWLCFW